MLISFLFSILLTYLFLISPFILFFLLVLVFWINNFLPLNFYILILLSFVYLFLEFNFQKFVAFFLFTLLTISENLFYLKFNLDYYLIEILAVFYLFVLLKIKNLKKIKILKFLVLVFMLFISFFNLFYYYFEPKKTKISFKVSKDEVDIIKGECSRYFFIVNVSNETFKCLSFRNLSNLKNKNYFYFVIEENKCIVY
jgi:hypothetical protein